MKHFIFSILSLYCFSVCQAQLGSPFPPMQAETLTNEFVDIPEDLNGKYSVVGLAYSKKSEKDLKTWFEPIYNQFIYKSPNPGLFDFTFDINLYFVPMVTGAKRPAYQGVMKKLKKSIDKKLHPHLLFYKGELSKYKKELNFRGKDVPYFFVLSPDGEVLYHTFGIYSDKKMQEIVDKVEESMSL